MRLAYFTNTYPRATDTFIRREVVGLRQRGFDVATYSVRKASGDHDVDPEVISEKQNTHYILPAKPLKLARVMLETLAKKPRKLAEVASLASKTARPGIKGSLLQVGYLLEAILLAEQLEQDHVEHVHNHLGDNSGTVTLLAAKLAEIPYSISIHGPHIFFDGPSWALDKKTQYAKFISCIGHFCTSQMMLYAAREHWHKFEIVRCGVDLAQFAYRPPARKAQKLVYVGRLASEKGLPVLFESLSLLRERELSLTLLGDGAERESLARLTRELGVDDRVSFAGFVDQPTIRKILQESDVFVLPSFAEGIPVALMEAMAIGLPVIATYVGGVTELVEDGVTGQVVAAADARGLAQAIARYADDLEFCRRISAAAREKVAREFAIEAQVDKLAALFAGESGVEHPGGGRRRVAMTGKKVSFALVGCGFVADYYSAALAAYPELALRGVFDKDPQRLARFASYHKLPTYASLDELLADRELEIVLNLTDPRSHYGVSKRCLAAKKHVYSEKPLAMELAQAEELVALASKQGVLIASAPCSVLGKAARTLSWAVRQKLCGEVKLVYAELDDGMVHKMAYQKWHSESGAPWPYRDEFEVGCTLEHAGYCLTWLVEMFGRIASVTAFSDCVFPDKVPGEAPLTPPDSADLSIGVLKFESGVVARLSTTIVAPHDHQMRLFGDQGILYLRDCWNNDDTVYLKKYVRIRRKTFSWPIGMPVKLPYPVKVNKMERGNTRMDFLLGVQAMADALRGGEAMLISPEFSLHVNEVVLALQSAGTRGGTYITRTQL